MTNTEYEIEFARHIKSDIIPKLDEFQRLLEYIEDKFEYFEFKDKVIISDILDKIHTKLDCSYNDFLNFNGNCIQLLKEAEADEALLENTIDEASSVDDYDCNEEDNYEENYFHKSNSNSSQTPYNERLDDEDEEVF